MASLEELLATGKILKTHNQNGYCYLDLNPYSLAFTDYASHIQAPVLDIGAGFGIATISALKKGASVIANDLEQTHLNILIENTPLEDRERLQICPGKIPGEVDFPDNTLGAIHASLVFHFLTGKEILQTVALMYKWLIPGGKIFIAACSPYLRRLEKFIPIYEARKKAGDPWPGFITNIRDYLPPEETVLQIPEELNFVDDEILNDIALRQGFIVEKSELFYHEGMVPDHNKYDGRENVGLIAQKPH